MEILWLSWISLIMLVTTSESSVPDVYSQLPGGVLPSPVKYFKFTGDQVAEESRPVAPDHDNSVAATNSERPQQPRLGYPLYNTGINTGYASTGTGVISPVKLDLGGLLLGTVIGLGAVLLIPKLLHVFSYNGHHGSSYGSYARNEDSISTELSQMISRMDEALAEQNINASSCLQRAVCSFAQPSPEPSTLSSFVSSVARNPLVSFLVEGSRFQKALDVGRSSLNCAASFPQCPFNQESIAKAISNSLPT